VPGGGGRVCANFSTRGVLRDETDSKGIQITDGRRALGAGRDRPTGGAKKLTGRCSGGRCWRRRAFFTPEPHRSKRDGAAPGAAPGAASTSGWPKISPPRFRDRASCGLTFFNPDVDKTGGFYSRPAFEQPRFSQSRRFRPEPLITLRQLLLGNTIRRRAPGAATADKPMIEDSERAGRRRGSAVNPIVEVPADVLLVTRMMGLLGTP